MHIEVGEWASPSYRRHHRRRKKNTVAQTIACIRKLNQIMWNWNKNKQMKHEYHNKKYNNVQSRNLDEKQVDQRLNTCSGNWIEEIMLWGEKNLRDSEKNEGDVSHNYIHKGEEANIVWTFKKGES